MFGNPPEGRNYIATALHSKIGYGNPFRYADPEALRKANLQLDKVKRAMDCSDCPYRDVCAAVGKESRYPVWAGGHGACLRYYERVEGLSGFFLPDGRPLVLTDEAVAAIREALEQTDGD